jgi:hypothetical protein
MLPGKFQYVVMVENRLFKPPYTKNSTEGEGSPAVEHGLSMCETLSSIPSTKKKKKETKLPTISEVLHKQSKKL